MTTIGDIDITLTPPLGSSPGLVHVIEAAQATLQTSIRLLAAGSPEDEPDLMEKLAGDKLPTGAALSDTKDSSATVSAYDHATARLKSITMNMQHKQDAVNSLTGETFDTSNGVYRKTMEQVTNLKKTLAETPPPAPGQKYLSAGTEAHLMWSVSRTVNTVHNQVADAANQMHHYRQAITASSPTYGRAISARSPTYAPSYTTAYAGTVDEMPNSGPSQQALLAAAPSKAAQKVIEAAFSQLNTHEEGKGNTNIIPGKPYNLNGAPWCASFATWVWQKAGYPSNWSNKNYVPSIWSDARKGGMAQSASAAQPGDLIIFPDESHIGVVVGRSGNTITTVEGNSGNAVREHTYNLNGSDFVGVVSPQTGRSSAA